MISFQDNFKEIKFSKDKYRISNLLNELHIIEPDEFYIANLIDLTNKVFEIKTSAISLLSNFNNIELEDFFITKIEIEQDKFIISLYVKCLKLNGTEKSIDFLIEFYKKTKSIDVKSEIIHTLSSLYIRNNLTTENTKKLHKLIGNNYPFFQGYWSDLKKAKKSSNINWKIDGLEQLRLNNLNLLYEYSSEIDLHIQIEKMNVNFIRYITVTAIYKNQKKGFSKYFTTTEFFQSESKLFDTLFDKTKQMRPDIYKDKIIQLIEKELIPNLVNKIELWNSLEIMNYIEFEINQTSIFNILYGNNLDWIIAHQLTNTIHRFESNNDKDKFINFVLEKWKSCNKETFQVLNYLEKQKNSS